ncbi:hypothetical protein [Elioraea sp.]|jgi:hypothetical protein|uniref:hypothetical protein n=1 Tax=Elioraea sp. TaxID=2185103 RepID=UPI003F7261E8
MAQHGGATMADDPKLDEFVRSRQRFYGNFITFTVWSIVGIVLLLVLMAVFLV